MSTVVNGHREDDNTHARPHGHVLPMLSFSASTPTEEENPLDNNPAIAIDMTLWEQPEDATGAGPSIAISNEDDGDEGMNPEAVPLIDVNRDVVLVDGPVDDDEPGENDPLLTGGGGRGGGGGGGRGCGDISESGFGGLGIPVNMPRRSSSHIGLAMENGEVHGDMESTIASFLRSKSESENLASSATTNSPEDSEKEDGGQHQKLQNGIHSDASVNELRDVASQLVCEVISQAQAQASRSNLNDKVEDRIEDPHSDERLMEIVRRFVSDIMAAAKAEAWDSMREIQNNNNNLVPLKVEDNRRMIVTDPRSDEHLMERVRSFVSEVLETASEEALDKRRQLENNNLPLPPEVEEKQRQVDPYADEEVMAQVRNFVSDIMIKAEEEHLNLQQMRRNDNEVTRPLEVSEDQAPRWDPRADEELMARVQGFVSDVLSEAQAKTESGLREIQSKNDVVLPRPKVRRKPKPVNPGSNEQLRETVRSFVSGIMSLAEEKLLSVHRELPEVAGYLPLEEEDEKEEEKVSLGDPHSDEQLMETVRCFVSDVISAAQKETNESLQQQLQNNNNVVFPHKIEDNRQISDPYSDEHLMDKVRGFVSEVLVAARNETEKSIQQLQNNNNILLAPKVKEKQEQPVTDPYSNEQLMERARSFVSEVMNAARENCERERLSQNNNKLVSPRKVDENERIEDRRKDEEVMERARSFVSEVLSAATETERLRQTRKDRVFPEVEEYELIVSDPRSDEELMSKVRSFVSDVMSAAVEKHERRQSQTISNKAMFLKVDERQRVADVRADERLMERVRGFVSDILAAAKETQDKKLQLQIKNGQMEVPAKEDAASAAEGTTEEEGGKSKRGPQNLASPASNHAERFFRGGPWYVQMGRVFSAFVSRICPCRCPTKP